MSDKDELERQMELLRLGILKPTQAAEMACALGTAKRMETISVTMPHLTGGHGRQR